ncbi:MAG: hypothetical protein ACE5NG_16860 [bacterium]
MKRKEEAEYFIELALEKAKEAIKSGTMDSEVLDIFLEQKKTIEKLCT